MPLSVDERDELRSTARSMLSREASSERVRATVSEAPGFDRALWDQMVELGWTSIHVSPEFGGAGAGYAELAVVLHELGRAIVPSPFLASAVLATSALSMSDNEPLASALLPGLAGGQSLGSVALASAEGSYELQRSTTEWQRAGGSIRLQGSAGFVLDADVADFLVVAAVDPDECPVVVAVDRATPGVRVERAATVDPTRRLFTVVFDDVVVADDQMLCEPGVPAEELYDRLVAVGVIAAACDATGVTEQALERAAEYAKERVQFGKPIGSFQAVKHHCANVAIAVEASRAAVRGAVEALDGDPRSWSTTASVTSSYVGPACAEACALALRVYGGIGFTWEHESHLYLKRVKLDELLFGTPSWHRRRLACTLIASVNERS
jgi:alkylation response protein AidB-like acyl-CoA dehydrogenase